MRRTTAKLAEMNVEELGRRLDEYVESQAARKKDGSIRALINELRPRLLAARRRGFTYAELTVWLNQQGVACGESTVRTYMSTATKSKRKTTSARSPVTAPAARAEKSRSSFQPSKKIPKGFKVIDDNEL